MAMIRYPLPITPAMLLPANENITKPRYNTPADWSMGAFGNEEDIATRTTPVVGPDSTQTFTPYPIRTQAGKAAAMTTALGYPATGVPIVDDLGKDYGNYAGAAGRTGPITPPMPYPNASSPPLLTGLSPNNGGVAGGTLVTISGAGFTGATAVTFGGTAATGVAVVNNNTITCTSPAKTAGPYDVVVTTPTGSSPAGTKFTYS
jgi:IPT/TIG domain-containing protein